MNHVREFGAYSITHMHRSLFVNNFTYVPCYGFIIVNTASFCGFSFNAFHLAPLSPSQSMQLLPQPMPLHGLMSLGLELLEPGLIG
mmetsp:Transcript_112729/g.268644  ORF Transcript_112729/g.268644 Transcript_112729/m.268644 type:complete len:86 (-) Transcript_112729:103-360(-)|eukprot:CAMPEP_0181493962 /NCGR_PEP_ID=MMETSP1110-20121109/51498_1 /TAXON_ID=174948 /ORGANISM="Symbiodinium sp., Strain CCMP421" /LENGTH=85 /DNA_ID=CAMNT_0023621303 /DNA_START=301 /DNA_END=558 /DNA_ORIENTATION=+